MSGQLDHGFGRSLALESGDAIAPLPTVIPTAAQLIRGIVVAVVGNCPTGQNVSMGAVNRAVILCFHRNPDAGCRCHKQAAAVMRVLQDVARETGPQVMIAPPLTPEQKATLTEKWRLWCAA